MYKLTKWQSVERETIADSELHSHAVLKSGAVVTGLGLGVLQPSKKKQSLAFCLK
jgi:hypothetical protein